MNEKSIKELRKDMQESRRKKSKEDKEDKPKDKVESLEMKFFVDNNKNYSAVMNEIQHVLDFHTVQPREVFALASRLQFMAITMQDVTLQKSILNTLQQAQAMRKPNDAVNNIIKKYTPPKPVDNKKTEDKVDDEIEGKVDNKVEDKK